MSSPRSQDFDEFDVTIGRELKNWGSKQQAPAAVRSIILDNAARHAKKSVSSGAYRRKQFVKRLQHIFVGANAFRGPEMTYPDLSQWLFSQAAWHNLGNDRRTVRFVC